MKKQAINYSWPADLSDFSVDEATGTYSRAKLKVFYKGETADHRFFSDEFANNLIETLPYTPVVSYYDEEKDDFVGHATNQQIYGIVDPLQEVKFENIDGEDWCVCDVVLYTERPDLVGKIAQKIVGHKQSLELDPSSVKYVINYDEKKHFKNLEFTAGKFIGVSVLGNDQQPAFTGSEFFAYNENFEKKMKLLRDYCESKKDQKDDGGNTMNLQEFMKLSWGEISDKVSDAIFQEYYNDAYTFLVDMFEDRAIVRFYYYMDGSKKLMGINYSVNEDGSVALGDIHEVRVVYENVDEPSSVTNYTEGTNTDTEQDPEGTDAGSEDNTEGSATEFVNEGQPVEETQSEENPVEDNSVEETPSNEPDPTNSSDDENNNFSNNENENESADTAQASSVESTPAQEKESVDDEQNSNTEKDPSSAAFTESERAEFEALKREEKITLVNSYKDDLTEEQYNSFLEQVDNFSKETLELEILKAYKANSKEVKPMRAFAFAPVNNAKTTQNSLDSFVAKHLGK